ncbi:MAG: fimbria major subunit [Muribaculaceae bacterium]|nr:fimbria major subunit [Muribaculaceae bacterium]
MKGTLDILKWLMPLVVLLATACGHDDLVTDDIYVEETVPYVELRIAVPLANPSATRANPMGGEEGNGRERGIPNEDRIHNINVFFFKGNMNSDGETTILDHLYYNLKDSSDPNNTKLKPNTELTADKPQNQTNYYYGIEYVTLKFKCTEDLYSKAEDINFYAVANIGPMQFKEGMKLKELMDIEVDYYADSWYGAYDEDSRNAEKMDYFLMSTAYDKEYTYGGQSTGTNKIAKDGKGTTTLQRLYARLDLWYNSKNNSPDGNIIKKGDSLRELKYQVVDKEGNPLQDENDVIIKNTVYLTNVLPVNVMQKPSFLFKKVTDFEEGWSDWSKSGFTGKTSFTWGGKESPNDLPTASSPNDKPLNYVMERHTLEKDSEGNGSVDDWYGKTAVSKVKTDIMSDANGKLSAYYHATPNSESNPNYNCDHISIISYANENTHPTDCFHSNYLTGMAFRAVYVPEKIYKEYTPATDMQAAVLTAMTAEEKTNFSIDKKIYRYSPSKDRNAKESDALYFNDKSVLEAYEKDHLDDSAVVTEFDAAREPQNYSLGFICYYNLWLRHYNDGEDALPSNPHAQLPMEYATVRNNIYRVSVSFSGPGDPKPTMREPDTMKARIFVRKWNYRAESEIIF